jgi:hypothetical protein
MKTKLITLNHNESLWLIGNVLHDDEQDGTVQYIGYSIFNMSPRNYIGDLGTENYFYIK